MASHIVKPGECVPSIAYAYGFADWRFVYEHDNNAALRRARPDPEMMHAGDVLYIPPPRTKEHAATTERLHIFELNRPSKRLCLALEDRSAKPIANASYELVIGSSTYAGFTDERGHLEQEIPVDARSGTLHVGDRHWKLRIGHLNPIEQTPDGGVSGMQARLRNLGYDPGPIDGIMGRRTKAALRGFQSNHPPLVVDGICGPKTRAKLIERHGC